MRTAESWVVSLDRRTERSPAKEGQALHCPPCKLHSPLPSQCPLALRGLEPPASESWPPACPSCPSHYPAPALLSHPCPPGNRQLPQAKAWVSPTCLTLALPDRPGGACNLSLYVVYSTKSIHCKPAQTDTFRDKSNGI